MHSPRATPHEFPTGALVGSCDLPADRCDWYDDWGDDECPTPREPKASEIGEPVSPDTPTPTTTATPDIADNGRPPAVPLAVEMPAVQGEALQANVHAQPMATPLQSPSSLGNSVVKTVSSPVPFPHADKLGHFPAFMSRSSLFRCGQARTSDTKVQPISDDQKIIAAGSTPIVTPIDIAIQGNFSMKYTGPRLGMSDKLVFEAVVDIAKSSKHDIGMPLRTSLRSIALAMGWKDLGGGSLRWISMALARLSQAHVEIDSGTSLRCSGMLLKHVNIDASGVAIQFDQSFTLQAFSNDNQFFVDRKRTATLSGSLAQWLHDFLSTHEQGDPHDLSYLREMSGFNAAAGKFPKQLRDAMNELVAMGNTLVASYTIARLGKKSSDDWKLILIRGTEKPKFILPPGSIPTHDSRSANHATGGINPKSRSTRNAASARPYTPKPPKRRPGVVL